MGSPFLCLSLTQGVIMLNIVKAFGVINCILATIIALCAISMLVVIYSGLCFLFGF